jgi:hypothetical protein
MTVVSIFDLWLPVMLEEVIYVRTLHEMYALSSYLQPFLLQTTTAGILALDSGYSCWVSCFPGGLGYFAAEMVIVVYMLSRHCLVGLVVFGGTFSAPAP